MSNGGAGAAAPAHYPHRLAEDWRLDAAHRTFVLSLHDEQHNANSKLDAWLSSNGGAALVHARHELGALRGIQSLEAATSANPAPNPNAAAAEHAPRIAPLLQPPHHAKAELKRLQSLFKPSAYIAALSSDGLRTGYYLDKNATAGKPTSILLP